MNLPQKSIIFCVERECVLRLDGSSSKFKYSMLKCKRYIAGSVLQLFDAVLPQEGIERSINPCSHSVIRINAPILQSERPLELNFDRRKTISVATIVDEQFWWHRPSIRRHHCWRAILVTSYIYPSCCLPFYIWPTTSSSNGSVLWMSRRSATSSVWSRSKASHSLWRIKLRQSHSNVSSIQSMGWAIPVTLLLEPCQSETGGGGQLAGASAVALQTVRHRLVGSSLALFFCSVLIDMILSIMFFFV